MPLRQRRWNHRNQIAIRNRHKCIGAVNREELGPANLFFTSMENRRMKVLVVGATGPLGLQIVSKALKAGHTVTAMVRSSQAQFPSGVRTVQGDVLRPDSLAHAVIDQDAVISSLGSKISFKPVTMLSAGTRNLVEAMRAQRVNRLVCITGIGAGDSKGRGGFLYNRLIQPLLLNEVYKDKTRQEEVVRESGLDWTIVRPAQLTNGEARGAGSYRVLSDLKGVTAAKIARADSAEFTVSALNKTDFSRRTVLITY
jgi:putative NADH-flavin reductase